MLIVFQMFLSGAVIAAFLWYSSRESFGKQFYQSLTRYKIKPLTLNLVFVLYYWSLGVLSVLIRVFWLEFWKHLIGLQW